MKQKEHKFKNDIKLVTMIIAAYNEEDIIREKLNNCLELDYPKENLEILIGSDGSTDETEKIIKEYEEKYSNIKLVALNRGGKVNVLNTIIPKANGEIIVFSDANTMYKNDAIKYLISGFEDENVGCVCGRLKIISFEKDGKKINGETAYWKYETFIKKLESNLGCVIGANGGIYAIRKGLFEELPKNTLVDDFLISVRILKRGYKCVYDEKAIAVEETAKDLKAEFKRKVRIGSGNFQNFEEIKSLSNSKNNFCYYSHKIMRWFVPFFMVLVLITSFFVYKLIFFSQIIFYIFSFVGCLLDKINIKIKLFYIPYYFCDMNLALFLGYIKYKIGIYSGTWERTERS